MTGQAITFREMLAPVGAEAFFERHYDRAPLHVPGAAAKLAPVFSWDALNALLNMPNVWTGRTMTLVFAGEPLSERQFCRQGLGRGGEAVWEPDADAVRHCLREGATMRLKGIEALSPAVASVAAALQVWFGGAVTCEACCSWRAQPGFAARFDTADMVVLQIAGTQKWRVYGGRFEAPIDQPGYAAGDMPEDAHARQMGAVLMSPELAPGALLYLPRGQYHDAFDASDACLHLSFRAKQLTGHDVLQQLTGTFVADPLFRKPMPSFDDAEAHAAHVRALADRMRDIIADPEASGALRDVQFNRAFWHCYPRYALPDRGDPVIYRVNAIGARVVRRGASFQIQTPDGKLPLGDAEAGLAEWVFARDFFSADELGAAARERGVGDATALGDMLMQAGLLVSI